jgi:hypothetical protein
LRLNIIVDLLEGELMETTCAQQPRPETRARIEPEQPAIQTEEDRLVPLVLGVTGHRNLRPEDVEALRRRVREVFQELRSDYPHTPLALLSPLNEGADRLAAEVAVEEGVRLIAVLPWPERICEERLHRTGGRAEFDNLLRRAAHAVRLPLVEESDESELRESEECRQRHYAQVGAYIARHSQILIALWDGVDTPESGTASVIRWQREGKTAPFAPTVGLLDDVESGPVYHIVTPRANAQPEGQTLTRKTLYPAGYQNDEHAERNLRRMWKNIDRFNGDAARLERQSPEQITTSTGYVLGENDANSLAPPLRSLLHCYALADAAALHAQTVTYRTLLGLFLVAFLAVACLETYAHLWDNRLFLAAYLILLGGGAVWYGVARRRGFQSRYIDYRALAEALRVQFFWQLAGLEDSVADHYLRHFRSDLDWIRQAVRACLLTAGANAPSPEGLSDEEQAARLRLVLDRWIEDQHKFFKKKAPQNEWEHKKYSWAASAMFFVAIGLAALQLTMHHHHHVLLTCMFLTLVIAALLHDYAEQRAFSVLARQYQWMESLFEAAGSRLAAHLDQADYGTARELIKELGQEALAENADWVIQHRQRPLELPRG